MRFPTQEEAAYPRPFCQQFILLVFRHLERSLPLHPAEVPSAVATVSSVRQPRGRKFAPVMPEYKRILTYQVHALPPVDTKRCLLQALRDAPAGSKLLSSTSLLTQTGDDSSSRRFAQPVSAFSSVAVARPGAARAAAAAAAAVCRFARPIQPSSFEVCPSAVRTRPSVTACSSRVRLGWCSARQVFLRCGPDELLSWRWMRGF